MSTDTTQTAGPAVDDFRGGGAGRTIKRLFHATRPKFYPASVLPVIAGTAWGVLEGGRFDAVVFLLALFATVSVHAGANVLNDVGDEQIGTDRRNEDRIYPYTGGSRFIQSGILSPAAMTRLGTALMIAAASAGAALLYLKGPMILVFGAVGVLLAVVYSLGPVKLSGTGLGELAVGFAFGVLPVAGSAWLQSGAIGVDVVLFSLPISVWVAAILLINEVPDVQADAASEKRTLPVRFGRNATSLIYMTGHVLAALVVVWLSLDGPLPVVTPLVPLLLLVLALKAAKSIRSGVDDRDAMTGGIEATLAIHTIGCLWLTGVVLYRVFFSGALIL